MTTFCTRAEMTSEGAPIQARAVDGGGGGDERTESVITTSDLQNTYSDSFFDGKISLPNLEHLGLHSVGSFKWIWHDELSRSSFCKLATITIQNCSDLLHIFPSTIIGGLTSLQSVKVFNCPSLKSLFDFGSLDSNTEQTVVLLLKLVSINIGSCPSLESLFNCGSLDSNDKVVLLPKLEEVSVSGAKRLSYLFSKYTATTLVKLRKLNITKCKQMKQVILEKEASRSEAKVMSLSCLSELTLKELDNLISFGSGSCSYYFSSLQDLRIVGCCNFRVFISSPTSVKTQLGGTAKENDKSPQPLFNEMVTFPNITSLEINGLQCKELWNNQIPIDSFQKLESLELNNCDNLRHIATSYMWKKLQRCLKKLKVFSCRSIEIIYDSDGTDTKSGELRRLALRDLENLRCIWQSNSLPNIPFPNLIDIEAVRCPRLEMLFPTFTSKSKSWWWSHVKIWN
ncbi:uncharacterized protein LOC104452617 [Eucalyptus grandis]|uniref:uncharacterized protein LOC104452617 n=1 Tax=Eucalyptus grandis TaxID=71139 RepID=UPI00192EF983|nr:uncharacterized protein LOC104452617 [Eucalyptus grandis]